jgi:hypothetical protein
MSSRGGGLAGLLCLMSLNPSSVIANSPTYGNVAQVYIHDCCGRGPYVAVVMDTPLNGQPSCSTNNTVLAISPASPLAPYLMAAALSAKRAGRPVTVHSKGSCDSTGVFDEWIGIQVH